VLVDEQDARNADFFVHTRPFLDGRRLHGAANRQCSGLLKREKRRYARSAPVVPISI
jgi:hypothetical protein